MPITGKNSLASLLRIILDILLVANILVLILLPWLLNVMYENPSLLSQLNPQSVGTDIELRVEYPADIPASSYSFYLAFLYVAGLGTAWILLEGHRILRRLERGEPFASGQAASFRRVSWAFAWLTAAFLVKVLVHNTLLTMFCTGLFLLLVLIAQILGEIFRQAYLVKSENELTI